MKKALILHGMPGKEEYYSKASDNPSNAHWLPWLQKELLINGYIAQTPEFPEPYNPQYEKWVEVFKQFTIDENTTLIGHSCGGGFLVRYLSENNIKIDKLILVAPWIDPTTELNTGFFDFEIDIELISRTNEIIMFSSLTDDPVVVQSVNIIKEKLPTVKVIEFEDKGHFCLNDLGGRKFPELKKAIICTT